jgi:RNA polymerase sigma factor (sigma-70 family)
MEAGQHENWCDEIRAQQDFLRRLARSLTTDEHRAADLTQDAWVAALRHPPHTAVPLRAWLGRVIRNASITRAVRGDRRAHRERQVARAEAVAGPEVMEERLEIEHLVVEAVQSLPEPHRRAIYLRYYENLAPAAIAKEVGAPLATVRSRLARGRALLRERLDRHFDGERGAWSLALLSLIERAPGTASPSIPAGLAPPLVGALLMTTKAALLLLAAGAAAVALLVWHPWKTAPPADVATTQPPPSTLIPLAAVDDPIDEANSLVREPELREAELREAGVRTPVGEAPPLPPADPLLAAIEVRVRHASDGTPGEGQRGYIRRDQGNPFGGAWLCDEAGWARIEGIVPGFWTVQRTCGSNVRVELTAGHTTEVEFDVAPGVLLRGLVVDPAGDPVPHASLYCAQWPLPLEIGLLVHTDEQGRFEVRDVESSAMYLAGAPGFASSRMFCPRGREGGVVEVTVRLFSRAGTIHGRVVDEHGEPIPLSRIAIVQERRDTFVSDEGITFMDPLPLEALTDEDGRFRVSGVYPGSTKVSIGATGFLRAEQRIDVQADGDHEIEMALSRGGEIRGSVRDASGTPIANAKVAVDPGRTLRLDLLSLSLRVLETTTDEEGNFSLSGLRETEVIVKASHPTAGIASQTLQLGAGEQRICDFVLTPIREVRGRVVDEEGNPLAQYVVTTRVAGSRRSKGPSAISDDDGRFHLADFPLEHDVVRVAHLSYPTTPLVEVEDLLPANGEVEVVVPAANLPSAFVEVRITGEREEEIEGATLSVIPGWGMRRTGLATTVDPVTLIARQGPLAPGKYSVKVDAPGHVPAPNRNVNLARDEFLDLGTVHLVRGGMLEASVLTGEDWRPSEPPSFVVRDSDGETHHSTNLERDTMRSVDLVPGRYTIAVFDGGVAYTEAMVEVRAGETTRTQIEVARGASRTVQVTSSIDLIEEHIQLELLDEDGSPVPFGQEVVWRAASHRLRLMGVVAGEYRLIARSSNGLSGSVDLEVDPLSSQDETIVIELE